MVKPCRLCLEPTELTVTIDRAPAPVCDVCCLAVTKQTVAVWEPPESDSDDRNRREIVRYMRARGRD